MSYLALIFYLAYVPILYKLTRRISDLENEVKELHKKLEDK